MKRTIYLDHAATTQPFPEVLEAMLPYYRSEYGNPSSAYELGERSRQAVEQARKSVAATLYAKPETVTFTSGGTESDNWALRLAVWMAGQGRLETPHREMHAGLWGKQKNAANLPTGFAEPDRGSVINRERRPPHVITSAIEHHAILRTCGALEREGVRVTYVPADSDGMVDLRALENAICEETVLISVMYANNEIGTIQPIAQIAGIARRHGVLFHTDAVQAYGQIPIHPERMGIDLLSASGHKFNGPKGVGFLYVRPGLEVQPMIYGGSQENKLRAGTENVPGIVGLGTAARISHRLLQMKMQKETALRNYFFGRILREIPDVKLNGSTKTRLPNNVNVCIRGVNGGALVALLDLEGVCASAASACQTGSGEPSHVQLAIGNSESDARSAVRFTLGAETTKEEIDETMEILKRLVEKLRSMG